MYVHIINSVSKFAAAATLMGGEQLRAVARGQPPAPRADLSSWGEVAAVGEASRSICGGRWRGRAPVVLLLGDPHLLEGGQRSRMEPIHTEYLRSGGGDDL